MPKKSKSDYNDKASFIAHIGIVTCILNHYISGVPRAAIYPIFTIVLELAREANADLNKAWDHATKAILEALNQMNNMAEMIDHEPVDIAEVQRNLAMWRDDPSTFNDEEVVHQLLMAMKNMIKVAPPTPNLKDLGKGLEAKLKKSKNPFDVHFKKGDIRWN